MPIYKKVNKNFFKKWTSEMAYVVGFFAADGYITVNKRGGQFWCIQITDGKLLKEIRNTVGAEHKISVRKGKGNDKTLYRMQIGSIEMCNDLRRLGFNERKTKSLAVPNVPEKHFPDFIRGYFDGDGNIWRGFVHKERRVSTEVLRVCFTSASQDFLELLEQRLARHKILGQLRCEKTYFRLYYSVQSSLLLFRLMYSGRCVLYLQRKKKVFDDFVKMRL